MRVTASKRSIVLEDDEKVRPRERESENPTFFFQRMPNFWVEEEERGGES